MTGKQVALVFYVLMGLSTGLTLARSFVFSTILSPSVFGHYATVVATGTFLGAVISFGLVEKSIKAFPTLYHQNRILALVGLSQGIERQILLRALGFCLAGLVMSITLTSFSALDLAAMAVIAGLVAATSAGASLLRASDGLLVLGSANLLRAVTALVFGLVAAPIFFATGAVAAEILGAVVFMVLVIGYRHQMHPATGDTRPLTHDETAQQNNEGRILFFASLAVSIPFYLDRLFLKSMVTPEALGTYAFLAILIMASSAATGIFAQVFGPQMVKTALSDPSGQATRRYTLMVVIGLGLTMAAGFCLVGAVIFWGPLQDLAQTYKISGPMYLAATGVAIGQLTALLDWQLIALGRPNKVLMTSLAFLFCATLAFLCLATGILQGITALLIALAASKALQIVLQSYGALGRDKGQA